MDHNLLRWINNFLNERTISVKIKNARSESFTQKHGVPQESRLNPVFCSIYVSEIPQPENVQTTILSQFADDIALWAYGRTTTVSQHKMLKHEGEFMNWCNIMTIRLKTIDYA